MAKLQGVIVLVTLMISGAIGLSFRNQPDTVTVYAGDTIYMRCDLNLGEVAGSSVSVTWIKADNQNPSKYISIRGHVVHTYTRFSIAGDSNRGEHDLMIRDVQYEDAGMYWCQAAGAGQVIESIAGRLTVRVPIPIPKCTMSTSTPRVGQRVTFICSQEMHPSVNYEALNWWNETSRTKIRTQGRYSDGSIFFTRLLSDSDQGQPFICSQSTVFVQGERNCTVVPLPAIEVSTIANPLETVVMNPTMKYVTEGSSAMFGCQSGAAPVSRWVFGYGSRAAKIRDTRGRFLVSADRSEFTVIRTTLTDNGTAVRCIVILPSGGKLVGESTLKVLPATTQPAASNPRIPPPPPVSTLQTVRTEQPVPIPSRSPSRKPSTDHRDTSTARDPSILGSSNAGNTETESQPNLSGGKTNINVPTTAKTTTTTEALTKALETTTRRDVVQIGANTGINSGVIVATEANIDQNHAGAPKIQTGGGYRVEGGNPHQVSNNEKPSQGSNSSDVVGAVLGSLLIIALIVLIIFLIKTKRYPKSVPTWIPPHVVAALKRPINMVKRSGSEGGRGGSSDKSSKKNAPMRLKQIEVVVNPPPPEWQFRLKDVESNSGGQVGSYAVSPRQSHMMDGPVYANLTPDLSKSQIQDERELDDDDDDDDSLFSSDFDDDLDLEGEIAAELVARSCESEGNTTSDSIDERKSKNVEGLVYAQLDLGPNAEKRSTVFIEGEKTQYAHIKVGNSARGK